MIQTSSGQGYLNFRFTMITLTPMAWNLLVGIGVRVSMNATGNRSNSREIIHVFQSKLSPFLYVD